jgi:hypothetical protein
MENEEDFLEEVQATLEPVDLALQDKTGQNSFTFIFSSS